MRSGLYFIYLYIFIYFIVYWSTCAFLINHLHVHVTQCLPRSLCVDVDMNCWVKVSDFAINSQILGFGLLFFGFFCIHACPGWLSETHIFPLVYIG